MKALLIIDMLHDFIDKDGALTCGSSARKIIPFIQDKIREFRSEGNLIVFIRDRHEADDPELQMFSPHCVENTYGARIIEELPVLPGDLLVDKKRSAFYNTELDAMLLSQAVDEAHVTGVCTSICVMDTIGDLRNRDFRVVIHKKGVSDFDA